jgi:hypothetical protein
LTLVEEVSQDLNPSIGTKAFQTLRASTSLRNALPSASTSGTNSKSQGKNHQAKELSTQIETEQENVPEQEKSLKSVNEETSPA